MLVAIHALENMYGGHHGVEDFVIKEVNSEDEAHSFGAELSRFVIDSFIDAEEFIDNIDYNNIKQLEELEQLIEEDISYEIQEIVNESKIELYKTNYYLLLDQFANDAEDFYLKYCRPI